MRATSSLSFEPGMSTRGWFAAIALRMRVSMSAIGSVILINSVLSIAAVRSSRLPHSKLLPARLHDAGDLPLKRKLAQGDPRNAELPQVPARAARLRTAVANANGAGVAGHLLKLDHRRINLFGRRLRIIYDLLCLGPPFCSQLDLHLALVVLIYFTDLCHN